MEEVLLHASLPASRDSAPRRSLIPTCNKLDSMGALDELVDRLRMFCPGRFLVGLM
jgi:hypothetical protein